MRRQKLLINLFIAISFCAANLFSYYRMPEGSTLDDGFVYFGWPFSIYAYGGYWSHAVFIWTGLIGNVFVALVASRVLSWSVAKLSRNASLNKTLLCILMFTCCLQQSRAQATGNTKPEQTRVVNGQVLTSPSLPSIRLEFDNKFKYAGTQKFILYERAQVEQFFFVDADDQRRIKRMYWVQFEGYLPGVDASYNYPVTETVNLGGQTYIVNSERIANVSAALKHDPQSDAAHTASFLESKGYRLNESIRFQRFVRLVDEPKRNEFIVLYIEDASAEASGGDDKEFLARAMKGFTILK